MSQTVEESSNIKYAISNDGEWYRDEFDSFEDAKAELRESGFDEGYIGEIVTPTPPEDLWEAADWLEHVSVQEDYSHEVADDWEQSSKEQREELENTVRAVLAAWLDKHGLRPSFFCIQNEKFVEFD